MTCHDSLCSGHNNTDILGTIRAIAHTWPCSLCAFFLPNCLEPWSRHSGIWQLVQEIFFLQLKKNTWDCFLMVDMKFMKVAQNRSQNSCADGLFSSLFLSCGTSHQLWSFKGTLKANGKYSWLNPVACCLGKLSPFVLCQGMTFICW